MTAIQGDSQRIAGYYDHLVDRYGNDPRASDAAKQESLDVRYHALAGVMDLNGKSVLDVGCALGGFGEYLHNTFEMKEYLGIDISARMIEKAKDLHPYLTFQQSNVLDISDNHMFDVVFAEGIFYLLGENAEQKMHTLIEKLFSLSREACACSGISTWHPKQEDGEYYINPAALIEWAAKRLSTSLVLRHDYHHGDCTLYLYTKGT